MLLKIIPSLRLIISFGCQSIFSRLCLQYCALLYWHSFRFRCGSVAVPANWLMSIFHHVLRYLKTLYIVWSLVRRRVINMCNILKYRKIHKNGCSLVAVYFSIYLSSVLYLYICITCTLIYGYRLSGIGCAPFKSLSTTSLTNPGIFCSYFSTRISIRRNQANF